MQLSSSKTFPWQGVREMTKVQIQVQLETICNVQECKDGWDVYFYILSLAFLVCCFLFGLVIFFHDF